MVGTNSGRVTFPWIILSNPLQVEEDCFPFDLGDFVTVDEVGDVADFPQTSPPHSPVAMDTTEEGTNAETTAPGSTPVSEATPTLGQEATPIPSQEATPIPGQEATPDQEATPTPVQVDAPVPTHEDVPKVIKWRSYCWVLTM